MNSILFNTIGNNKFENDSNKRLIFAKKPLKNAEAGESEKHSQILSENIFQATV